MRFAWRWVKLCVCTGLKGRVDVRFVPVQTGTDFYGLGQTAQINVTVDRGSATVSEFGLKLGEA
jgi:hypothetical protein